MAAEAYPELPTDPNWERPTIFNRVPMSDKERNARLAMIKSLGNFVARRNDRKVKGRPAHPPIDLTTGNFEDSPLIADTVRLFVAETFERTIAKNKSVNRRVAEGTVRTLRQQAVSQRLDAYFAWYGVEPPEAGSDASRYIAEYHRKAIHEVGRFPEIELMAWIGSTLFDHDQPVAGHATSALVAATGHALYADKRHGIIHQFNIPPEPEL